MILLDDGRLLLLYVHPDATVVPATTPFFHHLLFSLSWNNLAVRLLNQRLTPLHRGQGQVSSSVSFGLPGSLLFRACRVYGCAHAHRSARLHVKERLHAASQIYTYTAPHFYVCFPKLGTNKYLRRRWLYLEGCICISTHIAPHVNVLSRIMYIGTSLCKGLVIDVSTALLFLGAVSGVYAGEPICIRVLCT